MAVWGAVGYFGAEIRPVVQSNYPATWMDEATKQLHGISDPNPIVLQWVQALKYMIDSGGDVSLSLAPQISAPVLLMLGDQDRLNPQAYGQKLIDATRATVGWSCSRPGTPSTTKTGTDFQRVVGEFLKTADKNK